MTHNQTFISFSDVHISSLADFNLMILQNIEVQSSEASQLIPQHNYKLDVHALNSRHPGEVCCKAVEIFLSSMDKISNLNNSFGKHILISYDLCLKRLFCMYVLLKRLWRKMWTEKNFSSSKYIKFVVGWLKKFLDYWLSAWKSLLIYRKAN